MEIYKLGKISIRPKKDKKYKKNKEVYDDYREELESFLEYNGYIYRITKNKKYMVIYSLIEDDVLENVLLDFTNVLLDNCLNILDNESEKTSDEKYESDNENVDSLVYENINIQNIIISKIPIVLEEVFKRDEFYNDITERNKVPIYNMVKNKYNFIRHFIDKYGLAVLIDDLIENIYQILSTNEEVDIKLADSLLDNCVRNYIMDYDRDSIWDMLYETFCKIYDIDNKSVKEKVEIEKENE